MEELTGGCLCGSVRYTAEGPPRVHYCHCAMCRKATGSAFAVLAWVPARSLRWHGSTGRRERRSSPNRLAELLSPLRHAADPRL